MNGKEKKAIDGALREAQDNNNQAVIDFLKSNFEFDGAGNCIGFNENKIKHLNWYAKKPEEA
ncbi:MAG: hypothetical protein IKB30_02305 [Clostridia bacterium]|nr:hypothetical protein [Clostridia bacterium]